MTARERFADDADESVKGRVSFPRRWGWRCFAGLPAVDGAGFAARVDHAVAAELVDELVVIVAVAKLFLGAVDGLWCGCHDGYRCRYRSVSHAAAQSTSMARCNKKAATGMPIPASTAVS